MIAVPEVFWSLVRARGEEGTTKDVLYDVLISALDEYRYPLGPPNTDKCGTGHFESRRSLPWFGAVETGLRKPWAWKVCSDFIIFFLFFLLRRLVIIGASVIGKCKRKNPYKGDFEHFNPYVVSFETILLLYYYCYYYYFNISYHKLLNLNFLHNFIFFFFVTFSRTSALNWFDNIHKSCSTRILIYRTFQNTCTKSRI